MNSNVPSIWMNRATLLLMAIGGIVATARVHAQNSPHFQTLTNPTPNFSDDFGFTVAKMGDRRLVGAPRDDTAGAFAAGAAYLFNADGSLARTFLNPSLPNGSYFGNSIAALGDDQFLIGAPLPGTPGPGPTITGAVYLYHTNGTLLRTFLRPTPQTLAAFGSAVAAVGGDRVLVGAMTDNTGAEQAGAAYLFHTNGSLLVTITNPTPAAMEYFGGAVATVGEDKLLIGAMHEQSSGTAAGAAYLYDTNGFLMTTFSNPTPVTFDGFGRTLAALGHDRVLIAAPSDNTGAEDAGVAYLYQTNGTLLATFTNPAPDDFDGFGVSLAVVDVDKILIGSRDNRTEMFSGEAYLFSTNGTLLATLANPAPAFGAYFSGSVADAGSGRVLIGAYQADVGGLVYVFELSPTLQISRSVGSALTVFWPSAWNGWTLQQATNLTSTTWMPAAENLTDNGTDKFITVSPPLGSRFFRLFKP